MITLDLTKSSEVRKEGDRPKSQQFLLYALVVILMNHASTMANTTCLKNQFVFH